MHADRQRRRSELGQRLVVEIDERTEALALAADDGDHQGESVLSGTDDRARAATDTDPRRQRPRFRTRMHLETVDRRARGSRPVHGLLAQQLYEQVELLLEQRLVVGEVVAEQRERLDE